MDGGHTKGQVDSTQILDADFLNCTWLLTICNAIMYTHVRNIYKQIYA